MPVPTEQEIVARFQDKMRDWDTTPGVANGPEMEMLVYGLNVASSTKLTTDSAAVVAASIDPALVGVLGLAEKFPDGRGGFNGHCVIILPHENDFDIWSPNQTGGADVGKGIPWAALADFRMVAAMLFKPRVQPPVPLSAPQPP
jgi:hypothetical protein